MYRYVKKILIFLVVLLFGYQIVGCGNSSSSENLAPLRNLDESIEICGIVVEDGNANKKIQNAKVEIIENGVTLLTLDTDEKGSYCFESTDISEDTFFIKVLKEEYANGFVEVNNTNLSKIDNILLTKLSIPIAVPKSGKTIELDNNISLVFPADAVDENITVQATPTQMYQTVFIDVNSNYFYSIDIVVKKITTGEEIHSFSKPIGLLFPIVTNLSVDSFDILLFDEVTNTFIVEDVNKTIENGYLKIYFNHFSTYIIKQSSQGEVGDKCCDGYYHYSDEKLAICHAVLIGCICPSLAKTSWCKLTNVDPPVPCVSILAHKCDDGSVLYWCPADEDEPSCPTD